MEFSSLDKILKKSRAMQIVREQTALGPIQDRWRSALPEALARQTRVLRYKNGKLTVQVDSPALLQEMATYRKADLLKALAGHAELEGIVDILFRSA